MRGLLCCLFLSVVTSSLFAQTDHWETVIKAEEQWRYFLGTTTPPATEPASNWRTLAFNDASWLQGPGGFGYGASENGDNDDLTTIPRVMSVFIRKKFTIIDKSKIEAAVLSIDYDDGFVAYLNGTEIARANMDGLGNFPLFNVYATGTIEDFSQPVSFTIPQNLVDELFVDGENVLAIQVHDVNNTSSDLSSSAYLSVGINDGSFTYQTTPSWFQPPPEPLNFTSSNLPIIVITTPGGQGIPDDPKLSATMGVIDNGPGNRNNLTDPFNNFNGRIGIETRGESSQMFPKKSYAFETRDAGGGNLNVELLGFPAENDWILYAPYTDKSMVRNDITFKLSRDMGRYASRTRACEVVLNGDYQGVYILMEKIKVDNNRVDIASLNSDEISGDDVTGGYILRIDKWDLNDYPAWNVGGIDFQYFDPAGEDMPIQQQNYIKNFISSVNQSITGSGYTNPLTGYAKYIDVGSFIDHMLISELGKNVDGYRFSTYMYKDKDSNGGKLVLGPLWDFNLAYGNVDYNPAVQDAEGGWLYNDFRVSWFPRLMLDRNFQNKMKTRWVALRADELSNTRITYLIDSLAAGLSEAQIRNYQRWPILGEYVWPNQNWENNTYQDEVAYVKTWIIDRANWMDANMQGTIIIPDPDPDPVTGIDDEFKQAGVSVYPNPTRYGFTIEWSNPTHEPCDVQIFNSLGQPVLSNKQTGSSWVWKESSGKIQEGIYLVRVTNPRGVSVVKRLVKE